jgi:hypothetical protein
MRLYSASLTWLCSPKPSISLSNHTERKISRSKFVGLTAYRCRVRLRSPLARVGRRTYLQYQLLLADSPKADLCFPFPHVFDMTAFSRPNVERKSHSRYLPCRISRARFGAEQLSAASMNKRNDRDVLVTQKKKQKWVKSLMVRTR